MPASDSSIALDHEFHPELSKPTQTVGYCSLISVFAVPNAVDGDGIFCFFEEDAVIANAEVEQALEQSAERPHMAGAGFGIAVNGPRIVIAEYKSEFS